MDVDWKRLHGWILENPYLHPALRATLPRREKSSR